MEHEVISDLDDTIKKLFASRAPTGSELAGADISFELPDADWRNNVNKLTVNCYLYDVHENPEMRTHEPLLQRNSAGTRASWRQPPVRIDCGYCITAWSRRSQESIADEHRLLGQVLTVLLKHRTIPSVVLEGSLVDQIAPYPTIIALPDGVKNQPQFWKALDQQLKPSLTYVVTLALMLDLEPSELGPVVEEVIVGAEHQEERAG